ncbi:MAG: cysteine peptidase family C39 domain-containing protein, partial [Candidatus Omnitrophica bacterium]|nr:cysteine peptidase family C39 domain-containing protein [Candidatus Omnitrophota bacterium]
MNTLQPQTEDGFKSGFKAWIRVVAFVIVAVFLPEQFAQAIEYDPRVLWRGAKAGMLTPTSMLQSVPAMDIPLAVKTILTDLSGKQVNAVRFSSNLTVTLDKPLNLSKEKIEEIYSWLKGRPCGSKALYDLLAYKGIRAEEQDIAVMALSIDILNDVVKPEGNPEVIKNSLFALSKTSEFFGLKLYPVKINPEDLADNTPFIAHLNGGHYVLVTKVADGKVYVADEHKEDYLPAEKFLQEFSGYSLVAKAAVQAVLSDKEAQGIMGARNRRGEDFDWGKWATSLGITVGASLVLSGVRYNGGTNFSYNMPTMDTVSHVGQGLSNNLMFYSINRATTNIGQIAGWNNTTTRIVSGVATGFAAGGVGGLGLSALSGGSGAFITGSSTIGNIATSGFSWGGAFTGAASGLVYSGVSELARQQGASDSIASLVGSIPMMFTAGALNAGSLSGGLRQVTGANFTSNILPNIITVGTEEVLRRTTNLDASYNSMVGAALRAGMTSYGQDPNLARAISSGLLEAGLSYGTASLESAINIKNPFMEAFLVNTASAALRGVVFPIAGKSILASGDLKVGKENALEAEGFGSASLLRSVMGSVAESWRYAGLNTITGGYYNYARDPNFYSGAMYFSNALDWSYNAAYLGFPQALVQYGTDMYHYGAVANFRQSIQASSTMAGVLGLPTLGLVSNSAWSKDLILATYDKKGAQVGFSDFITGTQLGVYSKLLRGNQDYFARSVDAGSTKIYSTIKTQEDLGVFARGGQLHSLYNAAGRQEFQGVLKGLITENSDDPLYRRSFEQQKASLFTKDQLIKSNDDFSQLFSDGNIYHTSVWLKNTLNTTALSQFTYTTKDGAQLDNFPLFSGKQQVMIGGEGGTQANFNAVKLIFGTDKEITVKNIQKYTQDGKPIGGDVAKPISEYSLGATGAFDAYDDKAGNTLLLLSSGVSPQSLNDTQKDVLKAARSTEINYAALAVNKKYSMSPDMWNSYIDNLNFKHPENATAAQINEIKVNAQAQLKEKNIFALNLQTGLSQVTASTYIILSSQQTGPYRFYVEYVKPGKVTVDNEFSNLLNPAFIDDFGISSTLNSGNNLLSSNADMALSPLAASLDGAFSPQQIGKDVLSLGYTELAGDILDKGTTEKETLDLVRPAYIENTGIAALSFLVGDKEPTAFSSKDYNYYNTLFALNKQGVGFYVAEQFLNQAAISKDFDRFSAFASSLYPNLSHTDQEAIFKNAQAILRNKEVGNAAVQKLADEIIRISGSSIPESISIETQILGSENRMYLGNIKQDGVEKLLPADKGLADITDDQKKVVLGLTFNKEQGDHYINADQSLPWFSAPFPLAIDGQMSKPSLGAPQIDKKGNINVAKFEENNPYLAIYRADFALKALNPGESLFSAQKYTVDEKGAYFGYGSGVLNEWSGGAIIDFAKGSNGNPFIYSGNEKDPQAAYLRPVFANRFYVASTATAKNAVDVAEFAVLVGNKGWWKVGPTTERLSEYSPVSKNKAGSFVIEQDNLITSGHIAGVSNLFINNDQGQVRFFASRPDSVRYVANSKNHAVLLGWENLNAKDDKFPVGADTLRNRRLIDGVNRKIVPDNEKTLDVLYRNVANIKELLPADQKTSIRSAIENIDATLRRTNISDDVKKNLETKRENLVSQLDQRDLGFDANIDRYAALWSPFTSEAVSAANQPGVNSYISIKDNSSPLTVALNIGIYSNEIQTVRGRTWSGLNEQLSQARKPTIGSALLMATIPALAISKNWKIQEIEYNANYASQDYQEALIELYPYFTAVEAKVHTQAGKLYQEQLNPYISHVFNKTWLNAGQERLQAYDLTIRLLDGKDLNSSINPLLTVVRNRNYDETRKQLNLGPAFLGGKDNEDPYKLAVYSINHSIDLATRMDMVNKTQEAIKEINKASTIAAENDFKEARKYRGISHLYDTASANTYMGLNYVGDSLRDILDFSVRGWNMVAGGEYGYRLSYNVSREETLQSSVDSKLLGVVDQIEGKNLISGAANDSAFEMVMNGVVLPASILIPAVRAIPGVTGSGTAVALSTKVPQALGETAKALSANAGKMIATGEELALAGGNMAKVASVANKVGGQALNVASKTASSLSKVSPQVYAAAGRSVATIAVNEAVANGVSLAVTGEPIKDARVHALLVVSGVAAGVAPEVASLAKAESSVITKVGATVVSQSALWSETYLLTGIASDGLQGKTPTIETLYLGYTNEQGNYIAGHYTTGLELGAVFGGVMSGAATIANSSRVASFVRNHPVASTAAAGGVGAVTYPFAKTVLDVMSPEHDQNMGFFETLQDNYNPVKSWDNYVRGAVIGLGIGAGFNSGILTGVTRLPQMSAGMSKFTYGAGVGVLSTTGVNAIKGNYWGKENGWQLAGRDTLYGIALGGLSAIYIGKQGSNIVQGLKQYAGAGTPQSTNIPRLKPYTGTGTQPTKAFFNLIDLGEASGSRYLYNQALAGAIDWTVISPAFEVGRGFWGSYAESLGYKADFTLGDLSLAGLLNAAVTGPRSGLVMKPAIGLFQTTTTSSPVLTSGGLVERGVNSAKWTARFIKNIPSQGIKGAVTEASLSMRATILSGLTSSSKTLSALRWADSSIIFMPGFVTGTEKLVNATGMTGGMAEYAKWLPFFMAPNWQPRQGELEAFTKVKNISKILGIDVEKSTVDQVRKQYHKLGLQYHPDRVAGESQKLLAEETFKQVGEAYTEYMALVSDGKIRTPSLSKSYKDSIPAGRRLVVYTGEGRIQQTAKSAIVIPDNASIKTNAQDSSVKGLDANTVSIKTDALDGNKTINTVVISGLTEKFVSPVTQVFLDNQTREAAVKSSLSAEGDLVSAIKNYNSFVPIEGILITGDILWDKNSNKPFVVAESKEGKAFGVSSISGMPKYQGLDLSQAKEMGWQKVNLDTAELKLSQLAQMNSGTGNRSPGSAQGTAFKLSLVPAVQFQTISVENSLTQANIVIEAINNIKAGKPLTEAQAPYRQFAESALAREKFQPANKPSWQHDPYQIASGLIVTALTEKYLKTGKQPQAIIDLQCAGGKTAEALVVARLLVENNPGLKIVFATSKPENIESLVNDPAFKDYNNKIDTNESSLPEAGIKIVSISGLQRLASELKLKGTIIFTDEPQSGFQAPVLVYGDVKGIWNSLPAAEKNKLENFARPIDEKLFKLGLDKLGKDNPRLFIENKRDAQGNPIRDEFAFKSVIEKELIAEFKKSAEAKLSRHSDAELKTLLEGVAYSLVADLGLHYSLEKDNNGKVIGYATRDVRTGEIIPGTIFGDEGMYLNARARMIAVKHHAGMELYSDCVLSKVKSQVSYTDALKQADGFIGFTGTAEGFKETFSKGLKADVYQINPEPDVIPLVNMQLDKGDYSKKAVAKALIGRIFDFAKSEQGKNTNLLIVSCNSAEDLKLAARVIKQQQKGVLKDTAFGKAEVKLVADINGQSKDFGEITRDIQDNPLKTRIVLAQGLYDAVNLAAKSSSGKDARAAIILGNAASTVDIAQAAQRVGITPKAAERRMPGEADFILSIHDKRLTDVEVARLEAAKTPAEVSREILRVADTMLVDANKQNIYRIMESKSKTGEKYSPAEINEVMARLDRTLNWSRDKDMLTTAELSKEVQAASPALVKRFEDRKYIKEGILTNEGKVVLEQVNVLRGLIAPQRQALSSTFNLNIPVTPTYEEAFDIVLQLSEQGAIKFDNTSAQGVERVMAISGVLEQFGIKADIKDAAALISGNDMAQLANFVLGKLPAGSPEYKSVKPYADSLAKLNRKVYAAQTPAETISVLKDLYKVSPKIKDLRMLSVLTSRDQDSTAVDLPIKLLPIFISNLTTKDLESVKEADNFLARLGVDRNNVSVLDLAALATGKSDAAAFLSKAKGLPKPVAYWAKNIANYNELRANLPALWQGKLPAWKSLLFEARLSNLAKSGLMSDLANIEAIIARAEEQGAFKDTGVSKELFTESLIRMEEGFGVSTETVTNRLAAIKEKNIAMEALNIKKEQVMTDLLADTTISVRDWLKAEERTINTLQGDLAKGQIKPIDVQKLLSDKQAWEAKVTPIANNIYENRIKEQTNNTQDKDNKSGPKPPASPMAQPVGAAQIPTSKPQKVWNDGGVNSMPVIGPVFRFFSNFASTPAFGMTKDVQLHQQDGSGRGKDAGPISVAACLAQGAVVAADKSAKRIGELVSVLGKKVVSFGARVGTKSTKIDGGASAAQENKKNAQNKGFTNIIFLGTVAGVVGVAAIINGIATHNTLLLCAGSAFVGVAGAIIGIDTAIGSGSGSVSSITRGGRSLVSKAAGFGGLDAVIPPAKDLAPKKLTPEKRSEIIKTNKEVKTSVQFRRLLVILQPYLKEGTMEKAIALIQTIVNQRREWIEGVAREAYKKAQGDNMSNWFLAESGVDRAIADLCSIMIEQQRFECMEAAINQHVGLILIRVNASENIELKNALVKGLIEIAQTIKTGFEENVRALTTQERRELSQKLSKDIKEERVNQMVMENVRIRESDIDTRVAKKVKEAIARGEADFNADGSVSTLKLYDEFKEEAEKEVRSVAGDYAAMRKQKLSDEARRLIRRLAIPRALKNYLIDKEIGFRSEDFVGLNAKETLDRVIKICRQRHISINPVLYGERDNCAVAALEQVDMLEGVFDENRSIIKINHDGFVNLETLMSYNPNSTAYGAKLEEMVRLYREVSRNIVVAYKTSNGNYHTIRLLDIDERGNVVGYSANDRDNRRAISVPAELLASGVTVIVRNSLRAKEHIKTLKDKTTQEKTEDKFGYTVCARNTNVDTIRTETTTSETTTTETNAPEAKAEANPNETLPGGGEGKGGKGGFDANDNIETIAITYNSDALVENGIQYAAFDANGIFGLDETIRSAIKAIETGKVIDTRSIAKN